MSFSKWLRSNSEHYLLIDAQRRVAGKYDMNPPSKAHGLKDRFWRHVFTPVYRALPWGLRNRIIQSLPGSHRQDWPGDEESHEPAI